MRCLAVVCCLIDTAAASPCPPAPAAPPPVAVDPITPKGAEIAPDGGVVVSVTSGYGKGPAWLDALPTRELAPGLRLVPLDGAELQLQDDHQVAIARAVRGKGQPLLAAPVVRSAVESYYGPHGRVIVTAHFAGPPPAGALALIVYQDGKAIGWTQLMPEEAEAQISAHGGGCPGFLAPYPVTSVTRGDRVQLAWLDGSGRIGKRSSAVRVVLDPRASRPHR